MRFRVLPAALMALTVLAPLALAGCSGAPSDDADDAVNAANALQAITTDGLTLGSWSSNATPSGDTTAPLRWSHWAGAPFRIEATFAGATVRTATLVASGDAWRTRSRTPCTVSAREGRVSCTVARTSPGTSEFFVELTSTRGNTGVVPGNYLNYTVDGRTDGAAPYFSDSFTTAFGGSSGDRERALATRTARIGVDGSAPGASGNFVSWNALAPTPVCVKSGVASPVRVDVRDLESGVASVELRFSRDGWRTTETRTMAAVSERAPGWAYAQIGFESALPAIAGATVLEATVVARDATGKTTWLTDYGKNVVVRACAP